LPFVKLNELLFLTEPSTSVVFGEEWVGAGVFFAVGSGVTGAVFTGG